MKPPERSPAPVNDAQPRDGDMPAPKHKTSNTVNKNEISHFQHDSKSWWEENGPFKPLHGINPVRLSFIRTTLENAGIIKLKTQDKHLKKLNVLDVGCGGGLVCEPLARLGATVTGIDADSQAIEVARDHAALSGLDITYQNTAIEHIHSSFDIITALEIIEHVDTPNEFLTMLVTNLAPGGVLFISTLNRTAKSWALGIIAAEYILDLVPKGTHTWRQFVRPSELTRQLSNLGCIPLAASGITHNPLTGNFALAPHDLDVNYIMAFQKTKPQPRAPL